MVREDEDYPTLCSVTLPLLGKLCNKPYIASGGALTGR